VVSYWNPSFEISELLKYGNKQYSNNVFHLSLEIPGMSGVSTYLTGSSEILILKFSELLKYGNNDIDKYVYHRLFEIPWMSGVRWYLTGNSSFQDYRITKMEK
jgi:hypothetical protein